MRLNCSFLGLVLVLGCSASSDPENPGTVENNPNGTGGRDSTGSGGQQSVVVGSGGSTFVIPEKEFTDENCDNVLPVTYRDFSSTHPDFERPFAGDVVRRGLVAPTLGADHKPVFASTTGCPWAEATPVGCDNWDVTQAEIESQETFDQWYRNVAEVNEVVESELVLTEDPPGSGNYVFDSDRFFPLSIKDGGESNYDIERVLQNFHFTTEVHLQFTYVAGQTFRFSGDDDLWVFINDKLALDLGGLHFPAEGTIDFDAQAADLGIVPNSSYSMDIFHAERHTSESNFRIETNISCFVPVTLY